MTRVINVYARRGGSAVPATSVALAVAMGLLAGCGSSGSQADQPAPAKSSFPAAGGRSLEQILGSVAHDQNLAVLPTGAVYAQGKNRFGFGIFQVDNTPIANAQVALYAQSAAGGPTVGPFPASYESLSTEARYEAQSTADDPTSAKGFYATDVSFAHNGPWNLVAIMRDGSKLTSARVTPSVIVGKPNKIPDVGQKAPAIHTLTGADVGGNIGSIDTRTPHDDMHSVDFHDVLGKQPVVLLFATPALCQSRVCGPVVDVAEQVEHEPASQGVDFIHQEIYNENNVSKGLRPQVLDFGLRTEPWLFVVGKDGRISTRIEGAFSVSDLEAAVKKVAPSG